MSIPAVAVVGLLAALATSRWLLVTLCLEGLILLVLSPYVFAPAWFIRANFRAWTVSDEDGSKWPGPGLP
ncbi:MAG: hypothetical protein QOJ11_3962 [Frankiales bacterium]|jgi:hypothetical protein|nr:hypothetical protein [Frankiales bacterium]